MANPTLAQIREQARHRANMENSQFVSDAEFNTYINFAISDLRDKLISKVGNDYFAVSQSYTLSSGTDEYALPSDFYKLLWVEVQANNTLYYKIRRFEVMEKNYGAIPISSYLPDIRYRLRAGNLLFSPINQLSARNVRMWYVKIPTKLVADSDELDCAYNGWDEFVALGAARKALVKEESDVSDVDAELMYLNQRIEQMADNRDQAEPQRVYDNTINDSWWFGSWR